MTSSSVDLEFLTYAETELPILRVCWRDAERETERLI